MPSYALLHLADEKVHLMQSFGCEFKFAQELAFYLLDVFLVGQWVFLKSGLGCGYLGERGSAPFRHFVALEEIVLEKHFISSSVDVSAFCKQRAFNDTQFLYLLFLGPYLEENFFVLFLDLVEIGD